MLAVRSGHWSLIFRSHLAERGGVLKTFFALHTCAVAQMPPFHTEKINAILKEYNKPNEQESLSQNQEHSWIMKLIKKSLKQNLKRETSYLLNAFYYKNVNIYRRPVIILPEKLFSDLPYPCSPLCEIKCRTPTRYH